MSHYTDGRTWSEEDQSWVFDITKTSESAQTPGYTPDMIALYHAVNKMLLSLGADGEMNADQDEVCGVMNALALIDGGTYNDKM